MKKVLFIGVTNYNLEKLELQHLRKKFEGLSEKIEVFVLAKGKPFHKEIWNTKFYLLPPLFFFWPLAFCLGFYLCLSKKIDTIVAQSPLIEGLAGVIISKVLKKELIVEVHGDWEQRLPWFKGFLSFLAKISLRNADKVRVISSFTKEKAKNIAPDKPYFVFPTFTEIDSFLNEKDIKFEKFILFVGNLQKIKGIKYLIEAFSKIEKTFPEFKLVIVGEGPELNNLEHRDKVEFKGSLSLQETKNIMKNCFCLVLPSLTEGLGRVLMEAMALSKPVIGSNIGGIPDLIKDKQNGFLFEPGNSDEIAEKLEALLTDKELARKMGEKGRQMVEIRFSNQKYLENYLKMINIKP